MSIEVKIPAVGESITSGHLSTWHKKDGEHVESGDVLLTLETDKVSTELTAEKAGTLKIKVPEGTEVKIGEIVATIEEGAAAAPSEKSPKKKDTPVEAAPKAAAPAPSSEEKVRNFPTQAKD